MMLRVLAVESDPEVMLFLQDILTDLNGGREWSRWTEVAPLYAASWGEAETILARERIDVIVLDLDLPDCGGKDTFWRYRKIAAQIPVVLLLRENADPILAEQLLREGAQDFVALEQLDCAPLAHALRNAVDRHMLLAAAQKACMVDSLTGLLSRDAFLLLADRDRQLAETLQRRQLLILAEPKDPDARDEQQRDLKVVDAAEQLRNLAGATDLVARVGLIHLALSVLDSERESAEEIWARLHNAAEKSGITLGVAVFDPERPVPLDRLLELAVRDLKPVGAAI